MGKIPCKLNILGTIMNMNRNNIVLQLKSKISKLEIKLDKTKNLKSKMEILQNLNKFRKQYEDLLEIEHKSLENKYQNIISDKIKDIQTKIEKSSSKGRFFKDYYMNLSEEVLIKDSNYIDFINKFWLDIVDKIEVDKSIWIKFLIQFSDDSVRTLTNEKALKTIKNNPECLNSLIDIIRYRLNNLYTHYMEPNNDNLIKGFVMQYKVLSGNFPENVTKEASEIKKDNINRTVKIRNINYPLSIDPFKFGNILYRNENLTFVYDKKKDLKFEFDRAIKNQQIIKVFKEDKLINTITDYFIDLYENLFKRTSNNLSYWIKNGKIIFKAKDYNPKFIKKSFVDKNFNSNILTGDIETLSKVNEKGERYFEPYALSYYNGVSPINYYVTDYNNWEVMMVKYWNDLFNLELDNVDIYFHNLSGFDAIFILKPLLNMNGVSSEIMLRVGKYVQIKVTKNRNTINIKDSLLILPGSLSNLSKSFKINTPKEIFPRKLFENETFLADYVSEIVPDYNKYFNKSEVSLEDYNNYSALFLNKKWSLKDETLKYVDIDCIALHEILIKFGNIIFDRWGIDIKNTPTLPALCFKVFRTHYISKNVKIPIITGIPYRDIKQSYTGGSTDMYIPYGENIWCYDINSLYPTAMFKYKYPVGNFKSFENIGKLSIQQLENLLMKPLFGFIECKVNCPNDIKHPILQIRREVSKGILRTFSPVGTFTGWFHTEELKEAMKLGYKIEIISGYLFEEAEIFKNFINDLYKIKVEADKNKDQIWRLISKNLMNSLYGRFGMNQYLISNIIVDKDESIFERSLNIDLEDIIDLGNKLLLQYLPKNYDTTFYQEDLDINISIPIAASVTAYSRLIMGKYKNNNDYNLFYTDTDSLYISFKSEADKIKFESKYVDPLKLGYLKIENIKINDSFKPYERFYFFGAKFYVGIFNNEIDFNNKTKIRGLQKAYRSMINEKDIKALLEYNRKPIKIDTMKWYKDVETSKILIKLRPYNLDISNSKRSNIYKYVSEDNINLNHTLPIILTDNVITFEGNWISKDNNLFKDISEINFLKISNY